MKISSKRPVRIICNGLLGLTSVKKYLKRLRQFDDIKQHIVNNASRVLLSMANTLIFIFLSTFYIQSYAAVIDVYPHNANTSCNEEFENKANQLQAGDELRLHDHALGDETQKEPYTQGCRRAITVNGSLLAPITIRAAEGEAPVLTRPDNSQNNIDIVNSSYLIVRGLTFQGADVGVRFINGGHHITFEDNEIFNPGEQGITLNTPGNEYDSFVIRRNHIHHTGLNPDSNGEGMYVGCNNNACSVKNSIIEDNYIHDLRATKGGGNDGIEVKVGSYGNVIRNNVIHATNLGTKSFPCILVYGNGMDAGEIEDKINIVEGNVVWDCGEAIQVVADAIIRNNIIYGSSDTGISSYPHVQVNQMRNVTIVNNTIVGHPECLYFRWASASNMILANNAIYCPGTDAIDARGLDSFTISSNYYEGQLVTDGSDIGLIPGGSILDAFVKPGANDYWPKPASPLVGTADTGFVPRLDFNQTPRTGSYDVGAYETEGLLENPGWKIIADFKQNLVKADKYWADTSGNWRDTINWDLPGQPTGGESVFLTQSDDTNRTVTYDDSIIPIPKLNRLTIDATGTGIMTLTQSLGALRTALALLGSDGTGHYIQSGGVNVFDNLTMSAEVSSVSSYALSNTGELGSELELIGVKGTAVFTQSGGRHIGPPSFNDAIRQIILGFAPNGSGTYNLSGGEMVANQEFIGLRGTGTFNQSGGTNTVKAAIPLPGDTEGTLEIASEMGSVGTYNLSAGTLNAVKIINNGTFNHTGGTLNVQLFTNKNIVDLLGTQQVNGDFVQESSGRLIIDITNPNSDRIEITGSAEFKESATEQAIINIRLSEDYEPAVGDSFDILSAASITGYGTKLFDFPDIISAYDEKKAFCASVLENETMLRLKVLSMDTLPGDLDCDGDVDRDDIMMLIDARGLASSTSDPRDLDGDGRITVLDARQMVLLCTRLRCATE